MSHKILSFGLTAATLLFVPNLAQAQNLQVISQQGSASATAVGKNNTAISNVHQSAVQNQFGNPYGYGDNPQTQITIQRADGNATAIGENNTVITNTNQSSVQNQYVSPYGY
jgi:hypothetical protein